MTHMESVYELMKVVFLPHAEHKVEVFGDWNLNASLQLWLQSWACPGFMGGSRIPTCPAPEPSLQCDGSVCGSHAYHLVGFPVASLECTTSSQVTSASISISNILIKITKSRNNFFTQFRGAATHISHGFKFKLGLWSLNILRRKK